MKFVCALEDEAMDGWGCALKEQGHELIEWNQSAKPIFDIFDEIEPDFLIISISDITRGVATCLVESPNTIPLFYDSPVQTLSNDQMLNIVELRQQLTQVAYVFNFCHTSQLNTLEKWRKHNYQVFTSMRAVSPRSISRKNISWECSEHKIWASTISIITNYNPYLNKFILPLCNQDKYPVKIFGNGWPIPNAVGRPKENNHAVIYQNSLASIDLSENTLEPSQSLFDICAAGTLCISNTDVMSGYLSPNILSFRTPDELLKLVESEPWKKVPVSYNMDSYKDRISSLLMLLCNDGVIQ